MAIVVGIEALEHAGLEVDEPGVVLLVLGHVREGEVAVERVGEGLVALDESFVGHGEVDERVVVLLGEYHAGHDALVVPECADAFLGEVCLALEGDLGVVAVHLLVDGHVLELGHPGEALFLGEPFEVVGRVVDFAGLGVVGVAIDKLAHPVGHGFCFLEIGFLLFGVVDEEGGEDGLHDGGVVGQVVEYGVERPLHAEAVVEAGAEAYSCAGRHAFLQLYVSSAVNEPVGRGDCAMEVYGGVYGEAVGLVEEPHAEVQGEGDAGLAADAESHHREVLRLDLGIADALTEVVGGDGCSEEGDELEGIEAHVDVAYMLEREGEVAGKGEAGGDVYAEDDAQRDDLDLDLGLGGEEILLLPDAQLAGQRAGGVDDALEVGMVNDLDAVGDVVVGEDGLEGEAVVPEGFVVADRHVAGAYDGVFAIGVALVVPGDGGAVFDGDVLVERYAEVEGAALVVGGDAEVLEVLDLVHALGGCSRGGGLEVHLVGEHGAQVALEVELLEYLAQVGGYGGCAHDAVDGGNGQHVVAYAVGEVGPVDAGDDLAFLGQEVLGRGEVEVDDGDVARGVDVDLADVLLNVVGEHADVALVLVGDGVAYASIAYGLIVAFAGVHGHVLVLEVVVVVGEEGARGHRGHDAEGGCAA